MYARVLTFTGIKDFEAAVTYLRDTAQPIVGSQRGYKSLTASADRSGGVLGILSVWETEADRDASESALAKTRDEAGQMFDSELTVETFDERVIEVSRPPAVGSALMITRVAMDPAVIDDNVEYFKREVAPAIKATPGFLALRNMINPHTGDGMVGSVWEDETAMQAARVQAQARRGEAEGRVTFGDTSFREVLFIDMK